MEYVLFLGMKRVGSVYPNIDEAIKNANSKGIWNVCGIDAVDGKIKIVTRKSFKI